MLFICSYVVNLHGNVSKDMVDGLGELCNVGPIPCSKNTTDIDQENLNVDIEEMLIDGIISG